MKSHPPHPRRIDPSWRKARVAARLLLKAEEDRPWSVRDRNLAYQLAEDPAVTNRLIDQAVNSLRARIKNGISTLEHGD